MFESEQLSIGHVGVSAAFPPSNFKPMVSCLVALEMHAPTTHSHMYAPGTHMDYATFTPNKGTNKIRIDYIFHTNGVSCVPGSCHINLGLSRGDPDKDHRPLQASLVFEQRRGVTPIKRRVLDYDLAGVKDSTKVDAFCARMRDFPAVSVDIENGSHCFLLDGYVHDALVEAFPKEAKPKVKAFISDDTFSSIVKGHDLRRHFQKVEARFSKTLTFAVFGFWSGRAWRMKWSRVWAFNSSRTLHEWVDVRANVKALAVQVSKQLLLEKLTWADAKADQLEVSFGSGDIVGMHAGVSELISCTKKNKCTNKVTRVMNDKGLLAQTYEEERFAFREHFSNIMDAEVCKFEEVIEKDRITVPNRFSTISIDECWKEIPSPTDVLGMNGMCKQKRAPGENLIAGMIHHHFSMLMSYLMYPLVLKSFIRIQPPIQWKGGMLHEIFKGKGPSHLRKGYRDVLLADDSGKSVSKYVRMHLLTRAKKIVYPTQFGGGFNGGETSFTHLYVRCAMEASIAARMSCAVLFIDVIAAFASLLRRIVFDCDDGDEIWLRKLRAAGFDNDDIAAILEYVKQMSSWDIDCEGKLIPNLNDGSSMSINMAKEWYRNTWISQEGISNVMLTVMGSLAGTPLADLVYTVAMARILCKLRSSLESNGLMSSVVINGNTHELQDASFVDDDSWPITGSASNIVSKTVSVAKTAFDTFASYAMPLNFEAGKSEAVVQFAGDGKREALRKMSKGAHVVNFSAIGGRIVSLRFVDGYKHVGTKLAAGARLGGEVSMRCGAMRSGSYRLRKCVLKNQSIVLDKRLFILQCYLLTKGTFQCSTWSELPASVYKRFHSCIMSLYRDVCGCYYGNPSGNKMVSDVDMLYNFPIMCPHTILRVARIQLFIRLVRKAPPVLMKLVSDMASLSSGWTHSLLGDLRWLSLCPKFETIAGQLGDNSVNTDIYDCWFAYARDNHKFMSREVKKFARTRIANIPPLDDGKAGMTNLACDSNHECEICNLSFDTFQKMCLHKFKKHGVKNIWRLYIGSFTHCPVCLRQFWSRERLLNHVRYRSKVCKYNLQMRGPVCDAITADELDTAEADANAILYRGGKRRHVVIDPVMQLSGPVMPILQIGAVQTSHRLGNGHNYLR